LSRHPEAKLYCLVILSAAKDLYRLVILSAAKDPNRLVILSAAKDLYRSKALAPRTGHSSAIIPKKIREKCR